VTDGEVSFVVPVYNKCPFLAATVEGLRRQRGDFAREFVFIDDGSTDGSRELLAKLTAGWPDARVLTQANRGPAIATNRGFAAARHPLVKLVDADDVLLPDATAQLRAALRREPEAALAHGTSEGFAAGDDIAARLAAAAPGAPPPGELYDALPGLLQRCDLAPSLCLVRAEPVRRAGGCDERVFTQDYSLFLRLAALAPFVRVAAPVALMPLAAPGRVNDGGPQVLHDMNLALFHFLRECPVPPGLARPTIRRGLRRAWHWARRREAAGALDPSLLRLLRSYLAASPELLHASCVAFTATRAVRVPESGSSLRPG